MNAQKKGKENFASALKIFIMQAGHSKAILSFFLLFFDFSAHNVTLEYAIFHTLQKLNNSIVAGINHR